MATSYYKEKYFGKTDKTIYEICNVQCWFILESKLNSAEVLDKMAKNIFKHPYYKRLQDIPYRKFGVFLWQKAKNFDLKNHLQVIKNPLRNKEEIINFTQKIQYKRVFEDDQKPQWKIIILENVEDQKSAIMVIGSHMYSDGVGLMSFVQNIFEIENWIVVNMPKPSYFHKILSYVFLPFALYAQPFYLIVVFFIKFYNYKYIKNPLLTDEKSNQIDFYYSKQYDLDKMKNFKSREKVNLNDTFIFLYLKSIQAFYDKIKHKYANPGIIRILQAVSIRRLPKPGEYIQLSNQTNAFMIQTPLFDKKYNPLRLTPQFVKKFFSAQKVVLIYFYTLVTKSSWLLLPSKIYSDYTYYQNLPYICLFSAVPGPTSDAKIYGQKLDNIIVNFSLDSPIRLKIVTMTCGNKFNFQVMTDKSIPLTARQFCEIADQILTKEIFKE